MEDAPRSLPLASWPRSGRRRDMAGLHWARVLLPARRRQYCTSLVANERACARRQSARSNPSTEPTPLVQHRADLAKQFRMSHARLFAHQECSISPALPVWASSLGLGRRTLSNLSSSCSRHSSSAHSCVKRSAHACVTEIYPSCEHGPQSTTCRSFWNLIAINQSGGEWQGMGRQWVFVKSGRVQK